MKTDPSIIYIVPYHKHKVLYVVYREVQVDYFGKKGMSLLVMMELRCKVDGKISGL